MSEHKILKTEMRNPDTTNIDRMTTAQMLDIIQRENENAVLSYAYKETYRKRGTNPMDNFECTTQYVSGMANEETRDYGLYHR